MKSSIQGLDTRLQEVLIKPNFLKMNGIAKEVPIFIQTYDPSEEMELNRVVKATEKFLRNSGILVKHLDLFELVIRLLERKKYLEVILSEETSWNKSDLLDTLKNVSEPASALVPEIINEIGNENQITLLTGSGTVYPFLRTHSIIEALQPAMISHPIVIFFPGEYTQDSHGGSYLRLFGKSITTKIESPHYRAINLNYFKI